MQRKLWLAIAAAGLVAAPLVVQAASVDDVTIVVAQAGGGAGGGGGDSGSAGGSDTNNSMMAPGSNPPGAISPGAPSNAATGADVQSGAYGRTNPGTDDPDRLHNLDRRDTSGAGGTSDSIPGSPSDSTSESTTR